MPRLEECHEFVAVSLQAERLLDLALQPNIPQVLPLALEIE